VPIIEYLQLVEGQRPDVWVLNRFLIGQDELRLLILQEAEHRPVYIDSPPASLPSTLKVRSAGLLYQISIVEAEDDVVFQAK
jgi:hypothetical protein